MKAVSRFASAAWPIVAGFVAALSGHAVGADIRVVGSEEAVRVEVHDATRGEILAALGSRFALRYRGETDGSTQTATYEGSLRVVVRRVLEGYNYVINSRDGVLEVVVVGPEANVAVPPPRPIPHGRQE